MVRLLRLHTFVYVKGRVWVPGLSRKKGENNKQTYRRTMFSAQNDVFQLVEEEKESEMRQTESSACALTPLWLPHYSTLRKEYTLKRQTRGEFWYRKEQKSALISRLEWYLRKSLRIFIPIKLCLRNCPLKSWTMKGNWAIRSSSLRDSKKAELTRENTVRPLTVKWSSAISSGAQNYYSLKATITRTYLH